MFSLPAGVGYFISFQLGTSQDESGRDSVKEDIGDSKLNNALS